MPPDPSTRLSAIDEVLSRFGHTGFRAGQKEIVSRLLQDRSALAIFPTGGGKSLCYQLPALLLDGVTLVVSPLIALMKDQVESLHARGIEAERLDSTLPFEQISAIHDRMKSGSLKLVYVAPERLANAGFRAVLEKTKIALLAVDEAHCISEWGHNFRPDYLKLPRLAKDLKIPRVLTLTATATPKVAADICRAFGIASEDMILASFHRPNLHYHITPCEPSRKKAVLLERFQTRKPGASVVYVTRQQTAEEVATFLYKQGLPARAYHAGLGDETRHEAQEWFMQSDRAIIVATIAFGMGIDKSDIRSVYHYNLPKTVENLSQETGRAGRDGKEAHCEILACIDDRTALENFVYGDTPSPQAISAFVDSLFRQPLEFSISPYDLSQALDIRPLVLSTALTYLELDGVLTHRGPWYAGAKIRFTRSEKDVLRGHTPERQDFLQRLFDSGKRGRMWITLEVEESAAAIGETPERIRKALQYLVEMKEIEQQPFGLRQAYTFHPDYRGKRNEIIERLQQLFARAEAGELGRIQTMIDLVTCHGCFTKHMLAYFGETLDNDCGHCDYCLGLRSGPALLPRSHPADITLDQVRVIQGIIAEKHNSLRTPRQMARFLAGLPSPATSRARLTTNHDHFGMLADIPFAVILSQTETML